jgi:hypothetical protein
MPPSRHLVARVVDLASPAQLIAYFRIDRLAVAVFDITALAYWLRFSAGFSRFNPTIFALVQIGKTGLKHARTSPYSLTLKGNYP